MKSFIIVIVGAVSIGIASIYSSHSRSYGGVEVGQVWAYNHTDPFKEGNTNYVVAVKDGYVQYDRVWRDNGRAYTNRYSDSIRLFKVNSKVLKPNELPQPAPQCQSAHILFESQIEAVVKRVLDARSREKKTFNVYSNYLPTIYSNYLTTNNFTLEISP